MTGVKPGGADVEAEAMAMERNNLKAKGVFAIMPDSLRGQQWQL